MLFNKNEKFQIINITHNLSNLSFPVSPKLMVVKGLIILLMKNINLWKHVKNFGPPYSDLKYFSTNSINLYVMVHNILDHHLRSESWQIIQVTTKVYRMAVWPIFGGCGEGCCVTATGINVCIISFISTWELFRKNRF